MENLINCYVNTNSNTTNLTQDVTTVHTYHKVNEASNNETHRTNDSGQDETAGDTESVRKWT